MPIDDLDPIQDPEFEKWLKKVEDEIAKEKMPGKPVEPPPEDVPSDTTIYDKLHRKLFSFFELERMYGSFNEREYENHKSTFMQWIKLNEKAFGKYLFFPIKIDTNTILEYQARTAPTNVKNIYSVEYPDPAYTFQYIKEVVVGEDFPFHIVWDKEHHERNFLQYSNLYFSTFDELLDYFILMYFPIPSGFAECRVLSYEEFLNATEINHKHLLMVNPRNCAVVAAKREEMENVFTKPVFTTDDFNNLFKKIGVVLSNPIQGEQPISLVDFLINLITMPLGKVSVRDYIKRLMDAREDISQVMFNKAVAHFNIKHFGAGETLTPDVQEDIVRIYTQEGDALVKGVIFKL